MPASVVHSPCRSSVITGQEWVERRANGASAYSEAEREVGRVADSICPTSRFIVCLHRPAHSSFRLSTYCVKPLFVSCDSEFHVSVGVHRDCVEMLTKTRHPYEHYRCEEVYVFYLI